jgi:hypothetical protein
MVYDTRNYGVLGLRTEIEPVAETSCFIFSRIPEMGEVQNLSNSECFFGVSGFSLLCTTSRDSR